MTDQLKDVSDWKPKVQTKLSEVKSSFRELDNFFAETTKIMGVAPDNEMAELTKFPGLNRLMYLIPCTISRLEDDIGKENLEGIDIQVLLDGLSAIGWGIKGSLAWYKDEQQEESLEFINTGLEITRKLSDKARTYKNPRFFRDLLRIMPDFWIMLGWIDMFSEPRRIPPPEPQQYDCWSPERWLDYYKEQTRIEDPMISVVESEGLSLDSIEKGFKKTVEESEEYEQLVQEFALREYLSAKRTAAFDKKNPDQFLNLKKIPELKDENDEYEVTKEDLPYEDEENPEPWADSLPELGKWNTQKQSPDIYSGSARPDFTRDPVFRMLEPFLKDLFTAMKKAYLEEVRKSGRKDYPLRPALDHYLVMVALKTQARISSCGVLEDKVVHNAPRQGAYMFAMECLERIATAIEKFSPAAMRYLAKDARDIKSRIQKLLA